MVFMEDDTSVKNTLEILSSWRNEGPTVVVVEKSSNSFLCDNGEKRDEQMRR